MTRTVDYKFIDISDGVTKTSKLKHDVDGPYRVLEEDQLTVVIHRKELVEKITAFRVALAHKSSDAPLSLSFGIRYIEEEQIKSTLIIS